MRSTAILGLTVLVLLVPALAAADEGEDLHLPFLRADGAERSAFPVVPVLLPAWVDGEAIYAGGPLEMQEPASDAYPDVGDLLDELEDDDADAARRARLLAAVRAGFTRRVHVEIEARRDASPTRARLVADGALGTLWIADGREERLYPAELFLESAGACAEMRCLRVGPRLVASVADAGTFFVLRLAVHLSEVVEDVRFASRPPTLVAPRVAFAALVAEVPAAPGEEATLRCGDLVVTYRVTPLPSDDAPAGVRALPLDATRPLFAHPPLAVPGALLPEEVGADDVDFEPPVWPAPPIDTPAGVRRYAVEPGLLVLEGSETLLRVESARWARTLRELRTPLALRLRCDDGFALDLPVVRPAVTLFAAGTLEPVLRGSKTAIAAFVSESGPVLGRVFVGRTATIAFEEDGRIRIREARGGTDGMTQASRLVRPEETLPWGGER